MLKIAAIILLSLSATARANSLTLVTGLEAQDSSWSDDAAAAATLKLGYQWQPWGVYFLSEMGVARVDERVLQHIELGGETWIPVGPTYAMLRAGLTHRHESPEESIAKDFTTVLGFGDGIRHRAGAAAGAGWLFPLGSYKNGDIYASAEANADALFGAAGPRFYWGLGLGLGVTYDLGGTSK